MACNLKDDFIYANLNTHEKSMIITWTRRKKSIKAIQFFYAFLAFGSSELYDKFNFLFFSLTENAENYEKNEKVSYIW